MRVAAAVVLGRQRDLASVPLLLERLTVPETWEKPAVLVALGRIGSREAVPALVTACEHPAHWVRVCALHALGDLGVPEARAAALRPRSGPRVGGAGRRRDRARRDRWATEDLPVLLELLHDAHPWPRRGRRTPSAVSALTEAAPRIREELNDPVAEVKLAAVWTLGRLGDDGAREDLVRLLYGVRPGDADDVACGRTGGRGPTARCARTPRAGCSMRRCRRSVGSPGACRTRSSIGR